MFKKDGDVVQSTNTLLKNKDIKKLKKTILEQFPRLSQSPDLSSLDHVFSSSDTVSVMKLENRTLIYTVNDVPMIIDAEGRNRLYPTVYFLWKYPITLRQIRVPGPVSEFILRGADLFSPGLATLEGLETLERNEKVSLVVTGNPMPFAIGDSNVCYEAILVNHGQGRAVNIKHYYGDKLCKPAYSIPNIGFSLHVITSIEPKLSSSIDHESEGPNDGAIAPNASYISDSIDNNPQTMTESELIEITQRNEPSEDINNIDKDIETIQVSSNFSIEDTDKEDETTARTIDETIIRGLLLALRYLIKDDQLPILASNLWKQVQKAIICDPESMPVENSADGIPTAPDIKKSKFKQVSNLLVHATDILHLLECTNKDGIITITAINRKSHHFKKVTLGDQLEKFKSSVVEYLAALANDKIKESSDFSNQLSNLPTDRSQSLLELTNELFFDKSSNTKICKFKVIDVYKFSRTSAEIFHSEIEESVGSLIDYQKRRALLLEGNIHSKSSLKGIVEVFTYTEIKEIISKYFSKHSMEYPVDRKCVSIHYEDPLYSLMPSSLTSDKIMLPAQSAKKHETDSNDDYPMNVDLDIDESSSAEQEYETLARIRDQRIVGGVALATIQSQASRLNGLETSKMSSEQPKKAWKPISLPSNPQKGSNRVNIPHAEDASNFPSLGSISERSTDKASSSKFIPDTNTKDIALPPLIIRKDIVLQEVLKKISVYNIVVSNQGEFKIAYGKPPTIQLTTQKRAGNKLVTSIRGLEEFKIDIDSLVKDFKKKFACSVTVAPVKGIEKESEVVVQGSADVRDILIKNYGIPQQCVVVK